MIKPELYRVRAEYSQEGNTIGTTGDMGEHIEIALEFPTGEEEGCFVVIKSEGGWSIDELSDLEEIIERTKTITKKEETNDPTE